MSSRCESVRVSTRREVLWQVMRTRHTGLVYINFYSFGAKLLDRYLSEHFSFNAVTKLVSNRVTTI